MIQENHGLLVVVSQGQSRSPDKRAIEDGVAAAAAALPNTIALIVPHLYDLASDSQSLERIRQWRGPIVLLTWLFDRAAIWVMDRMDVRGRPGNVELVNPDIANDDEDEEEAEEKVDERAEDRVANIQQRPDRRIYSIDLRASSSIDAFENEFRRILTV
jgi:hypothetical protein